MNIRALESLGITEMLSALINNESGLPRIKMIEVETTDEFYFEQNPHDIPKQTMLASLIELDSEGDYAIRIGRHTASGSTKFNKSELGELQLLRSLIGKTSDGKPYLRMLIEPASTVVLSIEADCEEEALNLNISASNLPGGSAQFNLQFFEEGVWLNVIDDILNISDGETLISTDGIPADGIYQFRLRSLDGSIISNTYTLEVDCPVESAESLFTSIGLNHTTGLNYDITGGVLHSGTIQSLKLTIWNITDQVLVLDDEVITSDASNVWDWAAPAGNKEYYLMFTAIDENGLQSFATAILKINLTGETIAYITQKLLPTQDDSPVSIDLQNEVEVNGLGAPSAKVIKEIDGLGTEPHNYPTWTSENAPIGGGTATKSFNVWELVIAYVTDDISGTFPDYTSNQPGPLIALGAMKFVTS